MTGNEGLDSGVFPVADGKLIWVCLRSLYAPQGSHPDRKCDLLEAKAIQAEAISNPRTRTLISAHCFSAKHISIHALVQSATAKK